MTETAITSAPERTPAAGDHRLSAALQSLAAEDVASIPLERIAEILGGSAHAFALLILVLPETIPLPVPSVSLVLGIPLVLIAIHLVIYGDGRGLPVSVRHAAVPIAAVRAADRWIRPAIASLEGLLQPRWRGLAKHPRLVGILCLYLAIILALPIPLVNLVPAVCLAFVCVGLIRRDGLLIVIGFAGAVLMTAALFLTVVFATDALGGMLLRQAVP